MKLIEENDRNQKQKTEKKQSVRKLLSIILSLFTTGSTICIIIFEMGLRAYSQTPTGLLNMYTSTSNF